MRRLNDLLKIVNLPSSWKDLRSRLDVDFWVSILGYPMFIALVWYTGLVDELSVRIILTLLYTLIPLSTLLHASRTGAERRKLSVGSIGLQSAILAALLLGLSVKFDWPGLGLIVALLLTLAPYLWLFLFLIRRAPLLGVALVPAMVMAEAFLVIPLTISEGVRLESLLLPLFVILPLSIVWSVAGHFLLKCAQKHRRKKIWGPFLESILMVLLFLPLTALAIYIPVELDDRTWLAVSVTVVGVLFGSVASTPLRQFLLDVGRLSPIHRWEGNAGATTEVRKADIDGGRECGDAISLNFNCCTLLHARQFGDGAIHVQDPQRVQRSAGHLRAPVIGVGLAEGGEDVAHAGAPVDT